MKANEAPKKIYVPINNTNKPGFLEDYWYEFLTTGQEIEYIRADAFIEKAVIWLMDNIQDYTDDGMGEHSSILVQDLKEDFVKYMKGE